MAVVDSASIETAKPPLSDRVADAIRHATHSSHEAQLVMSMARDAAEEGIYAAKRAVKRAQRGVEKLDDLKDDAAHYVKHRPMKAVVMAAGIGLAMGAVVGWMGGRLGRHTCRSHEGEAHARG